MYTRERRKSGQPSLAPANCLTVEQGKDWKDGKLFVFPFPSLHYPFGSYIVSEEKRDEGTEESERQ